MIDEDTLNEWDLDAQEYLNSFVGIEEERIVGLIEALREARTRVKELELGMELGDKVINATEAQLQRAKGILKKKDEKFRVILGRVTEKPFNEIDQHCKEGLALKLEEDSE